MSKKGTKPQKHESSYAIRDVVLAKVRGFPAWPGVIVDPDNVPPAVTKERPAGKKTTFYCVRFFPAGDYAWLLPKDISKLLPHEIEAYIAEPPKKSGELLQGYQVALNPEKWEREKEAADLEFAEIEGNAEVDQLDSENDEEVEKKPKAKKRKRDSDTTSIKPKTKTKSKSKNDSGEEGISRKKSGLLKSKKNGAKSKEMVESEDEGENGDHEAEDDEDAGPSKKAAPPPAKKQKREKENEDVDATLENDPEARKVREWRHKLQKALLGSKGLPKDEEMSALDQLFTTVESYENINIQYLSFSKIGKVMRHIAVLTPDKVPRDDEFKFRDRARVLVDKWHAILSSSQKGHENGVDGGANGTSAAPEQSEQGVTKAEDAPADDGPDADATDKVNIPDDKAPSVDMPTVNGMATEEEPFAGDLSVLPDVTMSEA